MSAPTFVAIIALAWVVLLALIVALFHGWRWVDRAVDEEMNGIFSVRGGTPSPPGRGAQREERR